MQFLNCNIFTLPIRIPVSNKCPPNITAKPIQAKTSVYNFRSSKVDQLSWRKIEDPLNLSKKTQILTFKSSVTSVVMDIFKKNGLLIHVHVPLVRLIIFLTKFLPGKIILHYMSWVLYERLKLFKCQLFCVLSNIILSVNFSFLSKGSLDSISAQFQLMA